MQKDTETLILETAQEHFEKKGFMATRMQEIADDAGINKALLHYYFRSKEKLYMEILRRTLNKIIPLLEAGFSKKGSFLERSFFIIDTYIDLLTQNPHIPSFVMTELSLQKESFINEIAKHAIKFQVIQSYLNQMQEEIDEGKIKAYPPHQFMLNLVGMAVFPFMAKPIFLTILKIPDEAFNMIMQERKTVLKEFVKNALDPNK